MQQLLQMMQKISAEPNNNARSATASRSQLTKQPDFSAPESVEVSISEPSDVTTADPQEPPPTQLEATSEDVVPEVIMGDHGKAVAVSDHETGLQQRDEAKTDEIVVDAPVKPEKGGMIKRWINKAVSWMKRLIGF